jgi:hypothetical protein
MAEWQWQSMVTASPAHGCCCTPWAVGRGYMMLCRLDWDGPRPTRGRIAEDQRCRTTISGLICAKARIWRAWQVWEQDKWIADWQVVVWLIAHKCWLLPSVMLLLAVISHHLRKCCPFQRQSASILSTTPLIGYSSIALSKITRHFPSICSFCIT